MPPTPEQTDEALLAAHLAGDVAAFETLFRRWQSPARRHLPRMLDDPATADDLVVETFLRLHRHRQRWRPGTPVRPWLFTIARNLAPNPRRAQRLWGCLPLATAREASQPPPVARDEIRRGVAEAFATLPE